MNDFGELKKISLHDIWPHEANDFTPWLESNIEALGNALGLELEIIDREASVGDFSLDLLAKDLGSSRTVIIENQLTQTDHDHLGKLLTYAAGFDASTVVWISEVIRDEHRQALEWLNQRTDTETHFFAVVVDILKIDNSKPAFDFKLVVFPNEWQKSQRQRKSTSRSPKGEKYRVYFQTLIDELGKHDWASSWFDWPQNRYFSSGFEGIDYEARFTRQKKAYAGIYIQQGDKVKNKNLFDALEKQKEAIHGNFSRQLEWDRSNETKLSRIGVSCDGIIESTDDELEKIREWHIKNLLKLKQVFTPEIEQALETIT